MKQLNAALPILGLTVLGLVLGVLLFKLGLDLLAGRALEGWRVWLTLGLLAFTAEQVSAAPSRLWWQLRSPTHRARAPTAHSA
jgi:hypothetical protein